MAKRIRQHRNWKRFLIGLIGILLVSCIALSGCEAIKPTETPSPAPTPETPVPAPATEFKTVRTATVVVAAVGSSAASKAQADYVCDGTDDQVEIQKAIDSLPPLFGGKVVLLEGSYYISSPINLRHNLILEGQGIRSTMIKLANGANSDILRYVGKRETFLYIRDLLHLDNVFTEFMAQDGIHLEGSGWGLVAYGVLSEYNRGDGMFVSGGNGRITDSKLITNGGYGLNLLADHTPVIGCQIGENGKAGLRLALDGKTYGGRNPIIGNIFYNDSQEGKGLYPEILVEGDVFDAIIMGNHIDGRSRAAYGIYVSPGAQNTQIIGNRIEAVLKASIEDLGQNTKIGDNISD